MSWCVFKKLGTPGAPHLIGFSELNENRTGKVCAIRMCVVAMSKQELGEFKVPQATDVRRGTHQCAQFFLN